MKTFLKELMSYKKRKGGPKLNNGARDRESRGKRMKYFVHFLLPVLSLALLFALTYHATTSTS